MPVIGSDIVFYLSGGAANADPAASLGGVVSSVSITSDTLGNLFDAVTPAEAVAGSVEYRCFFVQNDNATDTLTGAVVWLASDSTSADTSISIGLDPNGVGDGVSPSAVLASPSDEVTAPAGVDFDVSPAPTSEGDALAIGDIGPGENIAIWVRRTVGAGAASVATDKSTITVKGAS